MVVAKVYILVMTIMVTAEMLRLSTGFIQNPYMLTRIRILTKPLSSLNIQKKRFFCASSSSSFSMPSSSIYIKTCKTADEIDLFGGELASIVDVGDVIMLNGDLGAGKTSLSRGIIRYVEMCLCCYKGFNTTFLVYK